MITTMAEGKRQKDDGLWSATSCKRQKIEVETKSCRLLGHPNPNPNLCILPFLTEI
jgi:hypothetical protein